LLRHPQETESGNSGIFFGGDNPPGRSVRNLAAARGAAAKAD